MPGIFYLTGLIVPSNTGHSYRVFALDDKGNRVFIGYVSRKALSELFQKHIPQADICKFSSVATQQPIELGL